MDNAEKKYRVVIETDELAIAEELLKELKPEFHDDVYMCTVTQIDLGGENANGTNE